ncbi:uncharacterized protein KIAA1841 homolog [Ctenocephalides felis]|uniref:uncharacterized protein KIAA1841 homolog n=1 Tax=Ctenocephalides felis TaxID=7515 RepID=UPI000E6E5B4A|nr:uncharacterized protein KIAA1841 homolog [Ctenocephalides felis]
MLHVEANRNKDRKNAFSENEESTSTNIDSKKVDSESLPQKVFEAEDTQTQIESETDAECCENKGAKRKTTMPKEENESDTKSETLFNSIIKQKLTEVLNEGLLDSILPYIAPNAFSMSNFNEVIGKTLLQAGNSTKRDTSKRNTNAAGDNQSNHQISVTSNICKQQHSVRRKSLANSNAAGDASSASDDFDKETVVIHVCDESKNTTRDFRCSQKLLVQQMGYFADVQAGQKLEDMDISVHCDISIFDWLMRWVKRDQNNMDDWPVLDAANVTPILVSATFLRMQPLVLDCLMYCHGNLSEVIRASTGTMTCLNDTIITRLAAMYTNMELEAVRDKRDRIHSRLFCRLICSLAEPDPETLRGHYASLRSLFKCIRCGQLVSRAYAHRIPCTSNVPGSLRLNKYKSQFIIYSYRFGDLVSSHQRDPSWTLSDHIMQLHKHLRAWRRVYWRLWGDCHYLDCSTCLVPFPVSRFGWCRARHPRDGIKWYPSSQTVVTNSGDAGEKMGASGGTLGATGSVGRHECCGNIAFRCEAYKWPSSCEYRDHMAETNDERENAILQLYLNMSQVIQEEPPEITPKEEAKWWSKLTIVPARAKSLIPMFQDTDLLRQQKRTAFLKSQMSRDINSESISRRHMTMQRSNTIQMPSSDSDTDCDVMDFNEVLSSSDIDFDFDDTEEGESEENNRKKRPSTFKRRGKAAYKKTVRNYSSVWSEELSARSNQDNQREYEEKAMGQLISMLNKKNGLDTRNSTLRQYPVGGTYIKLENEWKEAQAQWSNVKPRKNKDKLKH